MVSFADSISLLSLFVDVICVWLLVLLYEEELSVAELIKVMEFS